MYIKTFPLQPMIGDAVAGPSMQPRNHSRANRLWQNPLRNFGLTPLLRLFLSAVVLTLLALPSSAIAALTLTATERAWLAAHPVIRIGVDPDYPPYAFINPQGQADGVAAEITALVAEQLGVRFELVPNLSWLQILEGTHQHKVDLITTAAHLPEREAYLNFSHIYLPTRSVVMTRTETPRFANLLRLNGQRVALVKGYATSRQAIRRYPKMQVVEVATALEGLRAVSDGRANAFIGELGVNTLTISRHGLTNVKVNIGFGPSDGERYGVRKDWPELVPLLEKALDAIPQAEYNRIFSRWIPVSTDDTKPTTTQLDAATRARIATLPVLRVGVLQDRRPFDFIDADGQHQGLGADTLALLAERTGLKTRTVPVEGMEQLLQHLVTGKIDLALGVNGGAPGVPQELLSNPYFISGIGVFARKGQMFLGERRDLFNHRVAVINSFAEELLRRELRIEMQRYASMQDAVQAVLEQKSDFFVAETTSALRMIDDEGITGLRYAGALNELPLRLSIAVSPRIEGFKTLINAGLATITPEEKAVIRYRWVGAALDDGIKLGELLRWAIGLGLLVGVGFFGLYQWNRRLQQEVDRRTRLYAALNGCNEAITRCRDQNELFMQICRIAVDLGGMSMTWIGVIDPTTQLLQPVASFGAGAQKYLDGMQISADASSPFGLGLTGTAVREDRPVWCQDLDADPRADPWRQHHAEFSWRAECVLPLHRQGRVVAVITLMADKVGTFDDAARRLITDMVTDIDLGIDNFVRAAELGALTQQLQTITDHAPIALAQVDRELRYRFVNQNYARLFARQPADIVGKTVAQVIGDASYAKIRHHIEAAQAGQVVEYERAVLPTTSQSEPAVYHATWAPERDASGRVIGCLLAVLDITARKSAENQLRKLSQAVEQSSDSIIITDTKAVIEYVNDAFVRNTGYSRNEAIGQTPRIVQSGLTPRETFTVMWDELNQGRPWQGELHNQRKDGSQHIEQVAISPIRQSDGTLTHYVAVRTDITAQKAAAEQIEKFAFYDPLTGLANRRLLIDRLQHAMAAGIRDQRQGAVLYIDLDNFKDVNDTLGHAEGDLLLKQVSERLTACIREGDTAARLGGDEFVVLFEDITEGVLDAATQVQIIGEKILAALKHTYLLAGGSREGTASIGVALFGGASETDAEGPLKRAYQAMYQAKAAGRNILRFYDPQLQAAAAAQITLETGLRVALEKRQFVLYYQPKVSLRTGEIAGVEALIRWQREDGQLIPPNDFIPAAERTKLIVPMGRWVIEEACRQIRAWREAGLPEITVAVNVSAHQFLAGDLDVILSRVLKDNDVNPHLLEIELTESVLMEDPDAAVTMLNRIKSTGVSLSLDDFGTGYSSLAYLGRFPFDTLKIDRSFVQTMVTVPSSATIAMTIIDLAHRMRLTVVAEGVETEAQLGLLRKNGCDQLQGYLFSRPLAEPALRALLLEDKRLPPGPDADLYPKTLLLVDDEPNITASLCRALRRDGYRILIAQSGEEALELMASNEVHVLLSDQLMPNMTGTELLRRACVISPNTVRLILSGYTDLKTVTRSVNEGYIYKFMTKPWEDDELRANIADAFRHSETAMKQARAHQRAIASLYVSSEKSLRLVGA